VAHVTILPLGTEVSDAASRKQRLLEHFAREERFALAEDVLCDGIVARNSFCG